MTERGKKRKEVGDEKAEKDELKPIVKWRRQSYITQERGSLASIQLLCNVNYHYKQPLSALLPLLLFQRVGSRPPCSRWWSNIRLCALTAVSWSCLILFWLSLWCQSVLRFESIFLKHFLTLERAVCSTRCVSVLRSAHHYILLLMCACTSACTHEL